MLRASSNAGQSCSRRKEPSVPQETLTRGGGRWRFGSVGYSGRMVQAQAGTSVTQGRIHQILQFCSGWKQRRDIRQDVVVFFKRESTVTVNLSARLFTSRRMKNKTSTTAATHSKVKTISIGKLPRRVPRCTKAPHLYWFLIYLGFSKAVPPIADFHYCRAAASSFPRAVSERSAA